MRAKEKNYFLEEVSNKETGVSLDLQNVLTMDKAGITSIVAGMVERVIDGWADPMDAMIYAKKGEYIFKEVISAIKKSVELPEGKSYTKHNAVLAEKMTGVRFDFSSCGDPEWDDLAARIKKLEDDRKEREKYLKLITKPKNEFNAETGEVYQILPPKKTGSLSIQLTLK